MGKPCVCVFVHRGVDGLGEEGRRQQQQAASGCRRNAAAHASAAALAQTMAALLSIPSERPRWRFPPSANKGPGHPACPPPPPPTSPNISPSFLPSPHQLTSPQAQLRKLRASHHPLPPSSFSSTSPLAPPSITRLPPYSTTLEE